MSVTDFPLAFLVRPWLKIQGAPFQVAASIITRRKKKLWLCQMKTNVWQFLQKSLSFVRTIQRLIGTQQFCMSRCSMEELEGRKRMENDYNSNQTMCRVIPHVLRQLIWENEVVTLLIRVSCRRSSFIQKKKFTTERRQFLLTMK